MPGRGPRRPCNGVARCRALTMSRSVALYFAWMPAILTASPHKAMSAAIIAANSSGVLPSGSTPNAASRSANVASLAARDTSFAIRSTVSRGAAAGAISPFQVSALNPGNPDSAKVGTSAICRTRFSLDTASKRMAPLFACDIASDSVEIDGNVAGDDVGQRRRATLVAHGGHLEACAFEKQHRREMTQTAEYRSHIVQFVGAATGIVDEFSKRIRRYAGMDDQNVRIGPNDADGSKIFDRSYAVFVVTGRIAICDGLPISSMCPSADERATASAATAPTAAGRFSTTNCCPNASPRGCAIRRAMPSLLPPGAKGTMILTGFCGQICERAD